MSLLKIEDAATSEDRRLARDMDLMARHLSGDGRNLLLVGGYGRGEGGWIKEGSEAKPYNDYDVVIISKERPPHDWIQKKRNELAGLFGLQWVDISWRHIDRLKTLRPTVYHFDMRHGSRQIAGTTDVRSLLTHYQSDNIPSSEIIEAFFVRLYTLLGCFGSGKSFQALVGEPARFFRNQMAKAVLSGVDSFLLSRKAYHASYRERCRRFEDSIDDHRERELVRWALSERLAPSAAPLGENDVEATYFRCREFFLKHMLKGLSSHFGELIGSPGDLEKKIERSVSFLLGMIKDAMLRRPGRRRALNIQIAQSELVHAMNPGRRVDGHHLRRAASMLAPYAPEVSWKDWDGVREAACALRMTI